MPILLRGLHQVGGATLTHPWEGSSYLIEDSGQAVLVDCGSHLGLNRLLENIGKSGVRPEQIRTIICTQGHFDHVEAANHLKPEYKNIELAIHQADKTTVETGDPERTCASFFYNETFHLPCSVDITLKGEEEISVGKIILRIIHLPGHSPGHIGILAEINGLKIMFAGSTLHGAYGPRVGGNLDDWKRSLHRLQELDFDLFVESHSNCTLYADPKPRIEEALWKMETQYFQLLEAPFRKTRYEGPFQYP